MSGTGEGGRRAGRAQDDESGRNCSKAGTRFKTFTLVPVSSSSTFMRLSTLFSIGGIVIACVCAMLLDLNQRHFHRDSSSALPVPPRVPRKLCFEDYQTVEDAQVMPFLRNLEQTKTTKAIDAHFIKPFVDDLSSRMVEVEGVEVTKDQFPQLNATIETCARILHLGRIPRVFVSEHTKLPIATINYSDPVVVIESGLLNRFRDPDELRFLIGREFGHIQAGHARWLTCVRQAKSFAVKMSSLTGTRASTTLLPLLHWARGCEMTADNAGCLCAQNPKAVESVLVRLATGIDDPPEGVLNVDGYLRQSEETDLSRTSGAVLFYKALSDPIPFAPERIRQLRRYQSSERYHHIWE